MKKLVTAVIAALLIPVAAQANESRSVEVINLSNLHSESNNNIYVYAGVSMPDRDLVVQARDAGGELWSHRASVNASHQFPLGISISEAGVLVSGRGNHSPGFAVLFSEDGPLWDVRLDNVSDAAAYPSGESVVVGYTPDTGNPTVHFVSSDGEVVDSNEFDFGFPGEFDDVNLIGNEIYLRLFDRCGQLSNCTPSESNIGIIRINQDGEVLSESFTDLDDVFDLGSDFYNVYPWLTVNKIEPYPSGGFIASGFAMRNDTGQNCLVLAKIDYSAATSWSSGPLFCDEDQDLYENRGALAVANSGKIAVSVGSYYELSVVSESSGATDFINAIIDLNDGVVFSEQFGTNSTDHPISVSFFGNGILMSGNNNNGGALARTEYSDIQFLLGDAVSPNWEVTVTDQVDLPSAPTSLSLGRSVNSINVSWSNPEYSAGYKIDEYFAEAYSSSGEKVGECYSPASVNQCTIAYTNNDTYTVQARAITRDGYGESASESVELFYGTPTELTNVVSSASRGKITIRYSAPESDGGSRIRRYYAEVFQEGERVAYKRNARNRTAFYVNRLQQGDYTVRLYAQNARGFGDVSEFTVTVP